MTSVTDHWTDQSTTKHIIHKGWYALSIATKCYSNTCTVTECHIVSNVSSWNICKFHWRLLMKSSVIGPFANKATLLVHSWWSTFTTCLCYTHRLSITTRDVPNWIGNNIGCWHAVSYYIGNWYSLHRELI